MFICNTTSIASYFLLRKEVAFIQKILLHLNILSVLLPHHHGKKTGTCTGPLITLFNSYCPSALIVLTSCTGNFIILKYIHTSVFDSDQIMHLSDAFYMKMMH